MAVLITGGAGYIGAHVVEELVDLDEPLLVVDDLSTGNLTRVKSLPFANIDVTDPARIGDLCQLISEHHIDSVVHFAARKRVDESIARPIWYYTQNINGLANIVEAMVRTNVRDIVFSSSAAVYGETGRPPVTEDSPLCPINPYGKSKLVGEWLLEDAARAHGLRVTSLRYFNVAGCKRPELGDSAILNIVPMVFNALLTGRRPSIFGDDYPTPDGTCIRDFIHVHDLARAHVAALLQLKERPNGSHAVYNVGTGFGTSVKEMISIILEVTRSNETPAVLPRRVGDPPSVTANADKICRELGWQPQFSVHQIVESAWGALQRDNEN